MKFRLENILRFNALVFCLLFLCVNDCQAHSAPPAYLEINEVSKNQYDILWRKHIVHNVVPNNRLNFPQSCHLVDLIRVLELKEFVVQRFRINCSEPLREKEIYIDGDRALLKKVIVRIVWMEGSVQNIFINSDEAIIYVDRVLSKWEVAWNYFVLGFMHILSGLDHLLFILLLIIIIKNRKKLIKTITAFTIAHSITLILASLGLVAFPQKSIELLIVVSILYLCAEILRDLDGRCDKSIKVTWLIVFIFGLLHGLGFAGALVEVGIPQDAIFLALLSFNVGVEIGQLAFILTIVLSLVILKKVRLEVDDKRYTRYVVYVITCIVTFWCIQRFIALFG